MTVKEIEQLTGMTRANIRFYESQGLICPERHDNGYREYTQEHAETLLRIKLLRSLQLSLEDIRAIQSGQEPLAQALDRQLAVLSEQLGNIAHSQQVCQTMLSDQVCFDTLDAAHYLEQLDPPPLPQTDCLDRSGYAWRRYWARDFDLVLFGSILLWFDALVLDRWLQHQLNSFSSVIYAAVLLVAEPLLLRFFSTTPGKALMGIRVTAPDGGRLCWSEARNRTWGALVNGTALNIPILSLWRQAKSYTALEDGQTLPWEHRSELTIRDTKKYRYALLVTAYALLYAFSGIVVNNLADLPRHLGELNAAEFADNYREMAAYTDQETDYFFYDSGDWSYRGDSDSELLSEMEMPPSFEYTKDENGDLIQIRFSQTLSDISYMLDGTRYLSQMQLSAMAYVYAQEDFSAFSRAMKAPIEDITDRPLEDFVLQIAGVTIRCDVEYDGFAVSGGTLIPDGSGSNHFSIAFTMAKQ